MNKLIFVALFALFAVSQASPIGLGLPGYGLVTGLTKLPNLGFGNIGTAVNNINSHGYNLATKEVGPFSVRNHVQTAFAPIYGGFPVIGGGLGLIG